MMDLEELAARVEKLERRVDTLKAREERLVEAMREAMEYAYNTGDNPDLDARGALGALTWALDDMVRALEGEGC